MITSYSRGHKIYYDNGIWRYSDDNSIAVENKITCERPCARCEKLPTIEGYDACLGHVEGAIHACCGHGVEEGYIVYGEAE